MMNTGIQKATLLFINAGGLDTSIVRCHLEEKMADRYRYWYLVSLEQGLSHLQTESVDLVLLGLGGPNILEGLRRVKTAAPDLPVILMVERDNKAILDQALETGAETVFLIDDFSGLAWERTIDHAFERYSDRRRLNEMEKGVRNIIDHNLDGIVVVDREHGNILFANPAAKSLFQKDDADMVGQSFGVPTAVNETIEIELLRGSGEVVCVASHTTEIAWTDEPSYLITLHDITRYKENQREIERLSRLYKTTSQINHAIVHIDNREELFDEICRVAVTHGKFALAWIGLYDPDTGDVQVVAVHGHNRQKLPFAVINVRENPFRDGLVGIVLKNNAPHFIDDIQADKTMGHWRQMAIHDGYSSVAGIPFHLDGQLVGVMCFFVSEPGFFRVSEEKHLLDEMSMDISHALSRLKLEKDRRYAEEQIRTLNAELEKRVEERTASLTLLNAELEFASRTKDEFLANMSHELRTPLNSILGITQLLMKQIGGPLNSRQVNYLGMIETSGEHLLQLVNDVLDIAKIESGQFDFYPQPASADELCQASLVFIKQEALKKHITVTYNNDAIMATIYVDARRLKQMLVNLLSNAVKFTSPGGHISLEFMTDEQEDQVLFCVTDDGIGIAAKDINKLFVPFVQLDSKLSRNYEGTGLGLALVRKMAEMHGGSVRVESEVNRGSRFIVRLPWKQALLSSALGSPEPERAASGPAAGKETGADVPALHSGTILLAENDHSNVVVFSDYFESVGYTILVAKDGAEAIHKAVELAPDLILMDIQMPVMSGLDAIREIRTLPGLMATPIIALTALAMPGDRERCLQAGADEYVTKPVSLNGIHQLIQQYLSLQKVLK